MSKCEFWLKQVAFLGHVVNKGRISVDPSKVTVVAQWPPPKTVSEVISFMGLVGHYKRIVKGPI